MQGKPHPLLLALLLAPLVALPAASSEEPEAATFDSDGVSLRYLIRGAGEPVVLVHGFSASAETNWMLPGIANALAREFQVIALDNRGHGGSDKPHDPQAYGDEMAKDVVRLLDHLGLRKAHIVGYSMGGFITLKLLTMAPERFLSAVIGGAGWSSGTDDIGIDFRAELTASLEAGHGIAPLLRALEPEGNEPQTEEQIQAMNEMVMAMNDQQALAAVIRGMDGLTVTEEELRANEVPTLAIIGSLDPLMQGVDAMRGVMSNLEVQVIEGADHVSAIGNPELVEGIRDFFIRLCECV